ncbi:MAG: DUF4910 domain-containing protein [Chloroflexi bacterium]|nr:DUF4910 domain-containing protein [Chloroflexota bacterium]
MFKKSLQAIRNEYSGHTAKRFVGDITRFHRLQASPGYRQAAQYCLHRLQEAGVEAEVLSFPADDKTHFWSLRSFQEWDVREATLHLVEPIEARRKLADFRDQPIAIMARSTAFCGEAELALLEEGEDLADYKGLNLAGKVVLTKGDHGRVRELAVEKFGAIGIISDNDTILGIRSRMTLPDALQYTNWRWQPGDKKCFGFVVSPRQGDWLRGLIKKQAREGNPSVKVRVNVDSLLYDGAFEVVSGRIPGETTEEVLVVSHLCHFSPAANDNGSGPGANLEIARTLQNLIDDGFLDKPKRSIRFLFPPEMTGTYAYLATHEQEIEKMVAGVNMDMVGQNQEICGSSFLIERLPQALPSFADDLIVRLREEMLHELPSLGGTGRSASFRHAVIPYSGGSDHYIFSDPSVGVPMPLLIQWPDKYYHTSEDTLEKVDPTTLARSGVLAAAYAYFVANAGRAEATWLGNEMVARLKRELVQLIQAKLTDVTNLNAEDPVERLAQLQGILNLLRKKIPFLVERGQKALITLQRLCAEVSVASWQVEVAEFAGKELARGEEALKAFVTEMEWVALSQPAAPDFTEWEQLAASLVPRRRHRGPVSASNHLHLLSHEERERVRQMRKQHGMVLFAMATLAEYWADGERSLLEIADLVELETENRNVAILVEYFKMLQKMELVDLDNRGFNRWREPGFDVPDG